MRLIKAAALADEWEMTEAELHRSRRRNGWPCVKLSRTDIRFTEQQVEQIIAMQSRAASPVKAATSRTGQTSRSKRSA